MSIYIGARLNVLNLPMYWEDILQKVGSKRRNHKTSKRKSTANFLKASFFLSISWNISLGE